MEKIEIKSINFRGEPFVLLIAGEVIYRGRETCVSSRLKDIFGLRLQGLTPDLHSDAIWWTPGGVCVQILEAPDITYENLDIQTINCTSAIWSLRHMDGYVGGKKLTLPV